MSDLPLLDLLGEVLFPEHHDSELAGTIRAQVREALTELDDAQVVCISFKHADIVLHGVAGHRAAPQGGCSSCWEAPLRGTGRWRN